MPAGFVVWSISWGVAITSAGAGASRVGRAGSQGCFLPEHGSAGGVLVVVVTSLAGVVSVVTGGSDEAVGAALTVECGIRCIVGAIGG